jgi:phospholipid transport system substrate-binding protein
MRIRHLFPALLIPLFAGIAQASDGAAENRLKTSVNEVVSMVKGASNRDALIASVKPVIGKILNFGVMTKRSIGPGWKQLTPDQQQEATKLFTTLILRTYTAKFTPGECPSVEYKPSSSTAPGRVEIPTTSLYRGSRYDVVYRMEEQGGTWSITDVVIEGVSLVADYRSQFDAEFKSGGTRAVMQALQRSVAQTK